ncbi:SDR family NAD(P)-dependent oxidoreductase [Paenibacillus montanisoli]|uniref:Short-chain dehydrogenase n=1 Tax=Paenibacillus montanisoli TaxID=2081970 RepID=A0A328UCZ5_9BACL|nr:SDR family oxidoreductase [Paenibacillus montanisoli]RAP77916.1 short-chain dehydrogenase [Paenibacillus montanisoli]
MKLKNKVVFITDADSLSGKAIINRLAAEGAHFILNTSAAGSENQTNPASLETGESKAVIVQVDLCKSSEVVPMLEEAERQLGPIDILVHNSDVVKPALIETCEEQLFNEIMDANAKSAFICTQAAGKLMAARQSGKVVYVSSIHDSKPTGSSFAYSASKGAVALLAREAALVLGRHGINVNLIQMGPVEGDNERFKSDISALYDSYQYKVPNAVLGTHDDLGNLVLFLCSDEARYVNGANIRFDGGFLLHYLDFRMKKPQ